MNKKKRNIILTTTIALTIATGGTTYGVINYKQTQAKIETAKVELTETQESLTALIDQLESYELEKGYLSSELTQETLDEVKNKLNSLTESSVVYEVKDEGVESKLEVIKTDKAQVEQEVGRLGTKLAIQNSVNELFEGVVINGDEVTELAIKSELTEDEVNEIETNLEGSDEWTHSLLGLVADAKHQLHQITALADSVEDVVNEPTRDSYETALADLNDVKNTEQRIKIEKQLEDALTVIVEKEEEEARLLAEAEAKAEAERQAQAQAQAKKQQVATTNSGGNGSKSKSSSGSKTASAGTTSNSNSGVSGGKTATKSNSGGKTTDTKQDNESKDIHYELGEVVATGIIPDFQPDGSAVYDESQNTWQKYETIEGIDPSDWLIQHTGDKE